MKKKVNQLQAIKEIIINTRVGSQEELLQLLSANGYNLTQATLSRDLKQLKIAKVPGNDGGYVYVLPEVAGLGKIMHAKMISPHTSFAGGFISINFSGNLAVIKTRPGYAGGIAYDIDSNEKDTILGTIAGDDTILLVLQEGATQQQVIQTLVPIIPGIQ